MPASIIFVLLIAANFTLYLSSKPLAGRASISLSALLEVEYFPSTFKALFAPYEAVLLCLTLVRVEILRRAGAEPTSSRTKFAINFKTSVEIYENFSTP